MRTNPLSWTYTVVAATLAVAFAAVGLLLQTFELATSTAISFLLITSLAMTGIAFARLAMRVRRMELENEGLVEEMSQEFNKVRDKIEIFGEALSSGSEAQDDAQIRRVVSK